MTALLDASPRPRRSSLTLDHVDQFVADLDSDAVAERVQRDISSAQSSGARETPTFFVEGCRIIGSYDARTLTKELEHSRRGARTSLQ